MSAADLPRGRGALLARFRALGAPDLAALAGTHEAVFVGPAALRRAAPMSIALAGMPAWYGKRFDPDGARGINLLRGHDDELEERNPMTAAIAPSWLDGAPAIVVSYAPDAPRPWRWVRDEFRVADSDTLLGLTFAVSPRLRALAAPFTLERR
ncbi:MAG: hypothetical protein ACEQSX_06535 [Baekduiaceae bacterium]